MGQPLLMLFWDDGKDNFENSAFQPRRQAFEGCSLHVCPDLSWNPEDRGRLSHVRARDSVAA